MSPKVKYYVVWRGRVPGVYDTWADCQEQVGGFAGASFKSFATAAEARRAFAEKAVGAVAENPAPAAHEVATAGGKGAAVKASGTAVREAKAGVKAKGAAAFPQNPPDDRHDTVLPLPHEVTADAWAVDAACSGNPGQMEYRGVDLRTGAVVFHFGPIFGTNNIGEFLAIVHALALIRRTGGPTTIYSDSRNALLWVRKRQCKTTLPHNARTAAVFDLIRRAEAWLAANGTGNVRLLKWETRRWGEVPADFGRK